MKFVSPTAEIYVPDNLLPQEALARTTHMAFSAHQDDIEIMATEPILNCFQRNDAWFTGVIVTDGSGSARDDFYKDYTDEQMRTVRMVEQRKAAFVGEYAAQIMLDYPSKVIKNNTDPRPIEDIVALLKAARPRFVYTHNLADKHDTHVAVALRVIAAIRRLPYDERPEKVYGCEVWRDLDWMVDSDKVNFILSKHENLQAALLGVFDSQIAGGKRYDLATLGRRRANATYFQAHSTDTTQGLSFGMDLTPLALDADLDIISFIQGNCLAIQNGRAVTF